MKIINPKNFYEILQKTVIYSKCSVGLSKPMKFCPSCNIYFNSKVGYFCPFCEKEKVMANNNFIVNYYDLLESSFIGLDLSSGKKIFFNIDDVAYFDNQEEKYFIVNI